MGVKVRERDDAWWLFIDYKGKRKAKRVGKGAEAKKAANLAAIKIQARLAEGDLSPLEDVPSRSTITFQDYASLAYVRDQLGHASVQLTVDTYGHLIPGANRQAVDRLDDATIRNPAATGEIAAAQ